MPSNASLVALRKESVDRNRDQFDVAMSGADVALRKESVDRNAYIPLPSGGNTSSLSARRAWIEMCTPASRGGECVVALRKESVDRNTNFCPAGLFDLPVALRKESVDRNKLTAYHNGLLFGRSPQGERG